MRGALMALCQLSMAAATLLLRLAGVLENSLSTDARLDLLPLLRMSV